MGGEISLAGPEGGLLLGRESELDVEVRTAAPYGVVRTRNHWCVVNAHRCVVAGAVAGIGST